jgi:hypothetical protein
MIRQLDDGTIEVDVWIHPRSLREHIRTDCRAMRTMAFQPADTVAIFDNLDEARAWHQVKGLGDSCRWCFPEPDLWAADEREPADEEEPDALEKLV